MKFCGNCGKQLLEKERFCPNCGADSLNGCDFAAQGNKPIKPKRKWRIALLVVLGALVLGGAAVLAALFSNPFYQISRAAKKSFAADSCDFTILCDAMGGRQIISGTYETDFDRESLKLYVSLSASQAKVNGLKFALDYQNGAGTIYTYSVRRNKWEAGAMDDEDCKIARQLLNAMQGSSDIKLDGLLHQLGLEEEIKADKVRPTLEKIGRKLVFGENRTDVLGYQKKSSAGKKVYIFQPNIGKLVQIVLDNAAPMFADREKYDEIVSEYQDKTVRSAIKRMRWELTYTVQSGYLTNISAELSHKDVEETVRILIELEHFNEAAVELPTLT